MDQVTPQIEHLKAASDHFKHITTLSSGFILVMATLLEKLFEQPAWRLLVPVAFVAFALAILLSVAAQAFFIDFIRRASGYTTDATAPLAATLTLTTWGAFLVGVLALVVFAVKNLVS